MPDRVIRDELLTSERYWSVCLEAQQLFVHLLLRCDSLARYSGKNFTIRMACYPGHQRNPEIIEKFLNELNDADLIRLYMVDGERFIFIPRYRQRLRYMNSKYPEPPSEINDIKDLIKEKSDRSQSEVRPQSAEVKRSEVVPSSRKRSAPDSDALKDTCRKTKQAYSDAYEFRYGVPPVIDKMANIRIKAFCQSIAANECAAVAQYYLQNNSRFYVEKGHPPTLLATDAAKLRMEWATGRQITSTESIQADKTAARKNVFQPLIKEAQNREKTSQ